MAEVTSIDGDNWCLTSDVRDRIRVEIQNSEPDFETEIQEATDSVISWWAEATGQAVSERPTSDSDLDDRLQQATAYLAASEAHLKFAQNISSQNQGDDRHVFLEEKARTKFEEWRAADDLTVESKSDDSDVSDIGGEISSKMDDIISD